jgi:BirA family transcriptional regulator, biotin operon repressor / biotin---[acetyl-CoA-carboxylase] ligase
MKGFRFLIVEEIRRNLKTKLIGRQIHYFTELGSTQELAIYMAENNSEIVNGTAILAEQQDRGTGRLKSRWISPDGGIWLSIILKPLMPASKSPLLSFTAALAVCETIAQQTSLESKVKWPNDILINHKKVCGILLDVATKGDHVEYAVIGIGINANVNIENILPYLDDNKHSLSVTSLKNELSGKCVNRPAFLKLLLERFELYYDRLQKEDGSPIILNKIKDRLEYNSVSIEQGNKTIEGAIIGIGLDGSLLIKQNDGSSVEVSFGDTRTRE